MKSALEPVTDIIGMYDPERLACPMDMMCFVIPPPNGKTAIANVARRYGAAILTIGLKEFASRASDKLIFTEASRLAQCFPQMENYQEAFISIDGNDFIAYLEYWEDLSVIFMRRPVDDMIEATLRKLSEHSVDYLLNLKTLRNANTRYLDKLIELANVNGRTMGSTGGDRGQDGATSAAAEKGSESAGEDR